MDPAISLHSWTVSAVRRKRRRILEEEEEEEEEGKRDQGLLKPATAGGKFSGMCPAYS